jgi:hypothetical protein
MPAEGPQRCWHACCVSGRGLLPDGSAGEDQYTPHYFSVMSYNYQAVGLRKNNGDYKLDYAPYEIAGVSESALNEQDANAPSGITNESNNGLNASMV